MHMTRSQRTVPNAAEPTVIHAPVSERMTVTVDVLTHNGADLLRRLYARAQTGTDRGDWTSFYGAAQMYAHIYSLDIGAVVDAIESLDE
jgi:hypothetical protein